MRAARRLSRMDEASRPAGDSVSPVAARLGASLAGLTLATAIVVAAFVVSTLVPGPEPARPPVPRATTAFAVSTPVAVPATSVPATAVPATPAPTPVRTVAPTPAPPAVTAIPYSHLLGNYVALNVPAGTTFAAPFAGTVQIQLWQFINGQIVGGAGDGTRPVFPYVRIAAGDRFITYRTGAITKDTELLVQSGTVVKVGDPVFKVVGPGPASWSTFYDDGMISQVLVSLTATNGRELDPLPLLPLK